jgi:hypothetical protein
MATRARSKRLSTSSPPAIAAHSGRECCADRHMAAMSSHDNGFSNPEIAYSVIA